MSARVSHLSTGVPVEIGNPLINERRVVLVGKTGSGKSASGNTILRRNCFTSIPSLTSITMKCEYGETNRFGKNIVVVDTPGIFDTSVEQEAIRKEISRCIKMTSPGLHAFICVVMLGRFTNEEFQSFEKLSELFGKEIFNFMIILFTGLDTIEKYGFTIDDYLKNKPKALDRLLKECGNRYIAFDNETDSEEKKDEMVNRLLVMVDGILRENRYCYTNDEYKEAEKELKQRTAKPEIEEKRRFEQQLKEAKEEFDLKYKEQNKAIEDMKREHLQETTRLQNINTETISKLYKMDSSHKEDIRNERLKNVQYEYELKLERLRQKHAEEKSRIREEAIRESTKDTSSCIIL